jgi:hypothetical protein
MYRDTVRQTANVVSVVLALTVNILASALPLNGQNTGEISDRFKVYFVPAGYVFAIWGLIYIGWIGFAIYQALPAQKENPRLRRLGYSFALSGVFNAAWLFAWHYDKFGLSVIIMLVLLALLIASYLRLNVGMSPVTKAENWLVDVPFGTYLGWISVATIANIADWLYLVRWDGLGIQPQVWAVIMLAVAGVLGILMATTRHEAAFLFVLAWSFAGIAVKQAGTPMVAASAAVLAVIVFGLGLYSIWRRRNAGDFIDRGGGRSKAISG